MKPTVRGFQEAQTTLTGSSPTSSASQSEISDYDSTIESRDTTPTQETELLNTVKRGKGTDSGFNVRKLIDHFSASDSDTTEAKTTVTRRRKSKTSEHIEIPAGGERELRRKMAAQTKANKTVELWKALMDDMEDTLVEADRALDSNLSRSHLLGHLEGIKASEAELAKVWEKIVQAEEETDVVLEMIPLVRQKNKQNTRCSKLKGHIAAATEIVPPTSGATTGVIQVVNPTNFGDLKLPDFFGDYTEFDSFEANFKKLIVSGNLDDGGKVAHLLDHIKGEAKEYLGSDGLDAKSFDEIWEDLRNRYGKPWRITRAAVKKLMDIESPKNEPKDISRYWNQINEACKVAERLKLTASSIILNMGLLGLPVDFRSKMDDKLKPLSSDYILTRGMAAEPFNDVIAGEIEKPSKIHATLGFNTLIHPQAQQQNTQSLNRGQNNKKKSGKSQFHCLLCNTKSNNHRTWKCPIYNTGALARERMRVIGRCIYCATILGEHGQDCSHRAHCSFHPQQRHVFWLCMNYRNSTAQQQQQNLAWQNQGQQSQYHHQQQQYNHQQQQYHPQQQFQNAGSFSNPPPHQ